VAQVLVTLFDKTLVDASLQMANTLRKAGLKTEMYFEPASLGDQIRYAGKKDIPCVVILGPDEVAGNQVTVRNLRLKEQQTVKRSEAIELINKWMVR
jgi:histidyl-tRNA synthetase